MTNRYTLGERIVLLAGETGTIVGIIDRHEYAHGLETWKWQALATGLIVLLDSGAFTHLPSPSARLHDDVNED